MSEVVRDYPLSEIVLPMGGNSLKDENKLEAVLDSADYVAEEKYDGSRYLSIGGRFFSRRISDIDKLPVEKTENVPHLRDILKEYPLLILDGEVYYEGKNSNDVTSIMGSKPERAIELQNSIGHLNYMVYDILRDIDGNWLVDKPWHERRTILESTFDLHVEPLLHDDVNREIRLSIVHHEGKRDLLTKVLARGGEGIMLKNIKGKYVAGKKPAKNWIKVKKEITDDVIIMGYEEPVREYTGKEVETWPYWEVKYASGNIVLLEFEDGLGDKAANGEFTYPANDGNGNNLFTPVTKFYNNGWIGAIKFGQYRNGELVEVGTCSGMTEEVRQMFSENKDKYIGQIIEISAMERTKDGHFRHPQYLRLRDDKNANDCEVGVR